MIGTKATYAVTLEFQIEDRERFDEVKRIVTQSGELGYSEDELAEFDDDDWVLLLVTHASELHRALGDPVESFRELGLEWVDGKCEVIW